MFFFQAEDGIRDIGVTGVQTCALPISRHHGGVSVAPASALQPTATGLDALTELLVDGDVVVLSGAGLSTDSGIPDYRGATGSLRRHTPMTYQTFTRDPRGRHRYWARSRSEER